MVTTRSAARSTPGVGNLNNLMKRELRKTLPAKSTIQDRYGNNNASEIFRGEIDNIAVKVTYKKNTASNAFKVNPKIPKLEDGVYTYIIDVKNGVPSLKCSPVQMFEAGSKHIQLAKNSDDIFAAGEFKKTTTKNGSEIEYNLLSGTFKAINRTMLPGGTLQHSVIQHVFRSLGATHVRSIGKIALIDEFGSLWKNNAGRFLLDNPAIEIKGVKNYELGFYIDRNYIKIPQRVKNAYYKQLKNHTITRNQAYKNTISNFINKAKEKNTRIKTLEDGLKSLKGRRRRLPGRGGNTRLYYKNQRKALGMDENATDEQVENKMKKLMPNLNKYKKNLNNFLK